MSKFDFVTTVVTTCVVTPQTLTGTGFKALCHHIHRRGGGIFNFYSTPLYRKVVTMALFINYFIALTCHQWSGDNGGDKISGKYEN